MPSRYLGAGPNDPAPQLKDRGPTGSLFLRQIRPPPPSPWVEIHRMARPPIFLGLIDIGWREMRRTDDYDVDIATNIIFDALVITDDTRKELT